MTDMRGKLNELMREYSSIKGDPGNKGRCLTIKNEVASIMLRSNVHDMLIAFAVSHGAKAAPCSADDLIAEIFLECVDEYDPGRCDKFYPYFTTQMWYKIKKVLRREYGSRPKEEKVSEENGDGEKKRKRRIDKPVRVELIAEDDEGNTRGFDEIVGDVSLDPGKRFEINVSAGDAISEDEAESRQKFKTFMSQVIPCVINVREHRGKKEQYYRAFATDFYISSCKEGLHTKYGMNENEAFYVMDLDFADFTLTKKSRSFAEFETVPCKLYEDINIEKYEKEEIKTPFKNCVYKAYIGVSNGNISQKRKEFHQDIGMMIGAEEQVW